MDKSEIQENLVSLYLRLNGYLSSGFILQSDRKGIKGQIDIIAIRFKYHRQDNAGHNSSPYIEIPQTNIDIIVGEVKSKGQKLRFNDSLINKDNILCMFQWIGIVPDNKINDAVDEFFKLVNSPNSNLKTLKSIRPIKSDFGSVAIRPMLFSPERINHHNEDKFVHWTEIDDFLWTCLCPPKDRIDCVVRYDFESWGTGLRNIVKAYKTRQKTQIKFKDIQELYQEI